MTPAEQVANGAQMLDQYWPGWYDLIDLDTLDISECSACICGQLGRNLGASIVGEFPGVKAFSSEYGFDFYWDEKFDTEESFKPEIDDLYVQLDEEWEKAIIARREFDRQPKAANKKKEAIPA